MAYGRRNRSGDDQILRVILSNLTFERILSFLINIALILALIHYVIIPLGRGIGDDVKPVDNTAGQTLAGNNR